MSPPRHAAFAAASRSRARDHRRRDGAIEHYNRIIEACDDVDWVTQGMTIEILHDEERHRRLFEGYLREVETIRT